MKNNIIYLIVIIAGIFYFLSINNELADTGDNASYMIFAQSILNEGQLLFYNRINNLHSGYNIFIYPLLLSPIVYFYNFDKIYLLKIISAISVIITLFLFIKTFSSKIKFKILFFSLVIFAFNPMIIRYSHQIMSESLYLLLIMSFFYIIITKKQNIFNIILTSMICVLIYFTRNLGIVLFITLITYLIYLKEYKKAVLSSIITLSFIFIISLYFKIDDFTGGNLYFSIIRMRSQYTPEAGTRGLIEIVKTSIYNSIIYVLKILPDTFLYPIFFEVRKFSLLFWLKSVSGIILFFIILLGIIKSKFHNFLIINIFLIVNILVLLIWQIASNRYLHSLVPFLGIYLVIGVFEISKYIKYKNFKFISIILIILCNVYGAYYIIYNERTYTKKESSREYFNALYYIRDNIHKFDSGDNLIFSRKPTLTYVITGMKSIEYPFTKNLEVFNNTLKENNVRYILRDNMIIAGIHSAELYLDEFIQNEGSKFKMIYSKGETKIYLLKHFINKS